MEDDHLVIAERHIVEGERILAAQKLMIEQMRRKGLDTRTAESTLATFQSSLDSFYAHRDHIIRSLDTLRDKAAVKAWAEKSSRK